MEQALEELGIEPPNSNKIPCPVCPSEQTPACHIYEDHWYCYSCGKTGDGIGLIAAATGQNVRTLIAQRSQGIKRPLRVGPKLSLHGVNRAVKRAYRDLHDWWFPLLHNTYQGSEMWAFEQALDLYSDMFDTLRAKIEGSDGFNGALKPFEADKEIARVKRLLMKSKVFEERRAQETRLRG